MGQSISLSQVVDISDNPESPALVEVRITASARELHISVFDKSAALPSVSQWMSWDDIQTPQQLASTFRAVRVDIFEAIVTLAGAANCVRHTL